MDKKRSRTYGGATHPNLIIRATGWRIKLPWQGTWNVQHGLKAGTSGAMLAAAQLQWLSSRPDAYTAKAFGQAKRFLHTGPDPSQASMRHHLHRSRDRRRQPAGRRTEHKSEMFQEALPVAVGPGEPARPTLWPARPPTRPVVCPSVAAAAAMKPY